MNIHQDQKEWMDIRGKIKTRWDKISDDDTDKFRGNMHLIPDRIQSVYGITREKANQEYQDFKKFLESEKPTELVDTRRFN